MLRMHFPTLACNLLALGFLAVHTRVQADDSFTVPGSVANILQKHCMDCHGDGSAEGDVQLDVLETLSANERLALLGKVQEQLHLNQMPPEEEPQPPDQVKEHLVSWITSELVEAGQDAAFKQKIESPRYGNYVDHDKLFSGEYADLKGFTYDRDWLISEFIFKERINALLNLNRKSKIDGQDQTTRGTRLNAKIVNPFLLPNRSGVRYYANEKINSSHFLSMMGNAKYVASSMIGHLSRNDANYLPAVSAMTQLKFEHGAILKSRQAYLEDWIDELCAEVHADRNESMLPTYTTIELDGEISEELKSFGKNGWRGRIGVNSPYILNGTRRFARPNKDKLETIRQCEEFWFHMGHDRDMVARLLNTLRLHLASIVKYNKGAVVMPKKEALSSSELNKIKSTIKELRTRGMTYKQLISACMGHWRSELQQTREKSNRLNDELVRSVLEELYLKIHDRQPSQNETSDKSALLRAYAARMGVDAAVTKLTETLLLDSEFISRNEYGAGEADEHGRKMLSPRDASYAIAYALTDNGPDAVLVKAAQEGRLNTRADYKREIERLLKDRSHFYIIDNDVNDVSGVTHITNMPIRKLRFFREFFGYHTALQVFKDQSRFGARMPASRERLIAEADMLVDHILTRDKDVFETLLTTDKFYVFHSTDNESILQSAEQIRKAYDYFKGHNWKEFSGPVDMLAHKEFLLTEGLPGFNSGDLNKLLSSDQAQNNQSEAEKAASTMEVVDKQGERTGRRGRAKKKNVPEPGEIMFVKFINALCDLEMRFEGKNSYIAPINGRQRMTARNDVTMKGNTVAHYFNINPSRWDYPPVQPASVKHRMGMLTHPAWLQAFSQNDHTDPVTRGKWIREKLLAGTVPDIPIGVDAVVPKDHTKTFRQRLEAVTVAGECWKCHQHMNPLGNAFEMYDDFGRYRTEEELEHPDNAVGVQEISHHKKKVVKIHPSQRRLGRAGHYIPPRVLYKTKPVVTTGVLKGTGDSKLDGEVKDAHDMIGRLAKAQRVRQSLIRHAFRYFMGRNETLSDSKTLIDADEAYVKSGGSFDAVIVSLLTSDSFIYRKEPKE